MFRFLLAANLVLFTLTPAPAQEKNLPANARKAQAMLEDHLAKLGGPKCEILWKADDALKTLFPGHTFLVARYRQFPVARLLPEGLQANNLFVVDPEQKLHHLKSGKSFQDFFASKHASVENDKLARQALTAWLVLSQEYHQDGLFRFEVAEKNFQVSAGAKGPRASGSAVVTQGGTGELTATLEFADGRLVQVREMATLRAGPRPIDSSTR